MTTPPNEMAGNEAGAAPDRGSDSSAPAQSTPIGDEVDHHHDITDDDLPSDLQPTEDNPLAQGPQEDEEVSAFDPPGKVDGGETAGEADTEDESSL